MKSAPNCCQNDSHVQPLFESTLREVANEISTLNFGLQFAWEFAVPI
jgi:hypothetical protein